MPTRSTRLLCASLLPLLIAGCSSKPAPKQANFGPMPLIVVAAQQQNVPVYGTWVGTLDGYVNAQIAPEVTGYLVRQDYREGSVVHAGQTLFEIDPRPFQAALDKAKGTLQQEQAQLQLAQINLNRDRPLAQAHAIAQSQLDNDIQQVAADKGAIESDKADIETAQLNLGFTRVRSLVNGIAGIAQIQVGNLVSPTSVLTAVSQVNPIKVYFAISEQEYLELSQLAHSGGKGDLLSVGNALPLTLTLGNDQVYPYKGHIVFVDRAVDSQTGTLRIAASFPNPNRLLRPGQFGNITAETHVLEDALVIPQQALNEMQGSYQVAVVGADNKLHIQPVQLGPVVGNMQVIESGLKPGDEVAVQAVGKLRDGMPVQPHLVSTPPPNTGQPLSSEGN